MLRYTENKKFSGSIVLFAAALMAAPLAAETVPHGTASGAAHASFKYKSKWPQATLQAQAQTEVAQDTVHIVLATEIEHASQQDVAQALTRAVKAAMDRALENADDTIKVTSGNYRVRPVNDKDGKISNWRGRGEIALESTDFAAASELAASLSDLMAVASIRFSVSPRMRAAEEQKLLDQAAKAFGSRAQTLAEALGYAGYSLRSIELGGAGVHYEMAARGAAPAAMYAMADSIPLEGGTETVSVSVHGSVFLLDEKAVQAR